ncbi:Phosphatidylethanolamine N-methyltransferase [Cyberlindnera fabianii]|uniref:Phosphatidylethanolamine N-methyltransferase n=1 Tax=Cyberlindnera fabianii TaxID=36022 RepID=A0A1V2L516_CYBFA|nr:Phosphatidylethanolamine N-methyltransferase [Cyberlindnera fabianii]
MPDTTQVSPTSKRDGTESINSSVASLLSSSSSTELMTSTPDINSTAFSTSSSSAGAKSHKKAVIGRTPDGTIFEVPETHDMVRSLFDPTLRKSYGEILIFVSLMTNFWIYKVLGTVENRTIGFICLYAFWRLCYNLGIGVVLYKQSNENMLVRFAKRKGLFKNTKKSSLLQIITSLEIHSKMGSDFDVEAYPIEFNTWIVFRQFVDLILMQDFTTYMFLVYTCGIDGMFSQTSLLNNTRIILGSLLVVFNFWVKVDAHRVVKDYAWYWGDFFFLQESELTFDGVFNLSPHPMYSIGYIGYYGFALMTKSYLVLIVSLAAHALQFAFLNYVEEPHIEKTYGSDTTEVVVAELEVNETYLSPLVVFKNFNPIRITDYLTIILSLYTVIAPFVVDSKSDIYTYVIFAFALTVKLVQSFVVSCVLSKQSKEKFWTKLYLKYGLDNVAAYSNWQAVYNLLLVLSYSTLFSVACREILNGQFKAGTWLPLRVIMGGLLILLQMWTSSSIYASIGDFGWFYGDFFLPHMSTKTLSRSGIYRFLNDPERVLGVSGIWGLTLITYSPLVFILAMIWTIHMSLHLAFVEKPHMIKVYGEQQIKKNVSGVSLTLGQFIPKKLNNLYANTFDRVDNYIKKRTQSETVDKSKVPKLLHRGSVSHHHGYNIDIINMALDCTVEIGKPIKVRWRAPLSHHSKDWIGIYQVVKTGSSRRQTHMSSSGKWIAVNPAAYNGRSIGLLQKEVINSEDDSEVTGVVEFKDSLLPFEKGVYELRYHENGTHKVLAISHPFEIATPSISVDSKLDQSLLEIIKRRYDISTVDEPLNFKVIGAKTVSSIVSAATGIDIAPEVVQKLKSLRNIAERVIKSKMILDELNELDN